MRRQAGRTSLYGALRIPCLSAGDVIGRCSHHRRGRRGLRRRAEVRDEPRRLQEDPSGLAPPRKLRGGRQALQDADRDQPGRCRQRRRDGRPDQEGQARPRHQHGAALPGPADHGCVPGDGRALHGHGQLRAARRRQVRVHLAVDVPGQVQGQGHHGDPRLRLRSGPVEHLLRLRAGVPVRRDRRRSTSSTATTAATARRSPPTSIRRSTSAR